MKKYYYLVNVMDYKNGYSFMVYSTNELSYGEVIYYSHQMGYFAEDKDAEIAFVDECVTEYEIEHFEKIGCCYEL